MIREALTEISNKYLAAKKEDLKSHQLALYIRKCAKNLIKPALGDYAENFVFRSSAGIHQAWADVPWITIMDPEVTTTTQTGHYVVYLFSDGYSDQFGGKFGKKYMSLNFKKLLLKIQSQSIKEQGQSIVSSFQKWKGQIEQVDDVCVLGFKV